MQRQITGFRISPQQKRLWSLAQEDSLAYRAQCALRLEGPLVPEVLREALERVMTRHEILQTTFQRNPGVKLPLQVVGGGDDAAPSWHNFDLSGLSPEDQEARLEELMTEESRQPFDFQDGPLVSAALLSCSMQTHFLIINLPALCADTRTLKNLSEELGASYAACLDNDELTEEAMPYLHFSEWQNELLEDDESQEGRDYWRNQNLGERPALTLPYEDRSPRTSEFVPEILSIEIASDVVEGMAALSNRFEVSPTSFLLACWQVFLRRLTNQPDILVGTTFEGRSFEEMQGTFGPFAKVLPVRLFVEVSTPFSQIVRRVEAAIGSAFEWQEYFSWEDVENSPEQAEDGLFFPYAFEHAQAAATQTAGEVTFSLYRQHVFAERFKLKLCCIEKPGALVAELQYDSGLLRLDDVQRMAGEWQQLLRSIVEQPEIAVGKLEMLTAGERRRMLVEWNETAAAFPDHQCLPQLFEAQVERTPDATAITFADTRLTYDEINRRANQLAHHLRQKGVGPEVVVGLLMHRSVEMMIALLGVVKAGAAYLPLDPAAPPARLRFMLDDAGVALLITEQELATKISAPAPHILYLDTQWETVATHSEANLAPAATAQNLAYVIYTSGSTGQPKGVMIEHRSLVNYLHWSLSAYGLTHDADGAETAGAPVHSPLSFDLTITGLFAPLLAGRSVTLLPEGIGLEPLVAALADEHHYALLKLTPAHLEALNQLTSAETGAPPRLSAPRVLVIGGEQLNGDTLTKWRERAPQTRFVNEYGPTETVVGCCVYEVGADEEIAGAVPIGRPVANTRLYILDEYLNAVPVGVAGELYIAGAGVGRGYLQRAELTAERFVPEPYGGQSGARMYRTGDAARYRGDGEIEYLGRLDEQVKVRGYRIELGEIEAALRGSAGVEEAVVVVREEAGGEKRLVGYVVGGDVEGVSGVRAHLQEHLPEYMIPAAFVMLKSLPLTAHGKVDRRALPAPELTRPEFNRRYVAPRTSVEELLAGMWAEVLRLERIGVTDNFFEVGGHSLLATQLISRLRESFKIEVPLRSFFDMPTIAALAENIERELKAGVELGVPPILVRDAGDEYPLSFAQQRLWFLDHLDSSSAVYNIPAAVRLNGHLDIAVLEQTLTEVVRRHEILRAFFPHRDGRPVQKISATQPLDIPVVNLQHLSPDEREAEARRLTIEEARQPFDLARGPLLRASLLRLAGDQHIALLTMHHIISDGWSMSILIREVAALYQAFSQGAQSPLPELPVQYADFAHWQHQWLQGEVLERQLAYWRQQLAGVAVVELRADHPRPAVRSSRGAHLNFRLEAGLGDALKQLSRREGTTLFMTLMAGFKALLHRYTGQTDISVGTPIAGRSRAETEGLIGFFINTLVLRTDMSGDPSVRELLGREREVALGAYAHQDVPFEKLVDELQPQRNLSHSPLFQIMMVMQNVPQETLELSGITLSGEEVESGVAKFDLMLTLEETEQGLIGSFEYNTDLFEGSTIGRLAEHYERLLSGMASDVDQRVSQLPLLTEAERLQLTKKGRRDAGEFATEKCLHRLFEEQVERTPDAIAVVFEGTSLSYRELNERANQLAHLLRARGVEAETLVGVLLERSVEMIVAIVGTLKAGGAYLPLDPAYPSERLAFMLDDAAVEVVLTQQQHVEKLGTRPAQVLCLDSGWDEIERESRQNPLSRAQAQNLAYVIYTSGSTGQPKGVMVSHANVTRLFASTRARFNFNASDVWTLFHSTAFDFSVWELWGALLAGGRLVVVPYWMSRSPESFYELLRTERVTVLNQTPSAFRQLARVDQSANPAQPLALRLVIFGGEALELQSLRPWFERHGDEQPQLVNMYGITETTVHVTYLALTRKDLLTAPGSIIGTALPDLEVLVLDRHLQPVPVGVPGEMFVGGAGLARGYLNRPGLTAERFIAHPDGLEDGARLYRTGDLARYLANGELEYLGRIDQQVKIRGFRIELREIEVALNAHPAVKEALVLPSENETGEKRLVAYIVCQPEQVPTISEVRGYLTEKLPEHMIPAAFLLLDRFPLTAHGKIDRRALPDFDQARPELRESYVAPRTMLEEVLSLIWSQVIGVDQVGIHDNFFELGGDSIRSIQVSAQAQQMGWAVSVQQLFLHQTIHELAQVVEATDEKTYLPPQTEAFGLISAEDRRKLPSDVEDAYPLAALQVGMLFHSEYSLDTAIYHDIFSFHLRAPLDVPTLKAALQHLAAMQPTLRTSYDLSNYSVPMQLVHTNVEIPLEVTNLRHLPTLEQERLLAKWAEQEKARPFDWHRAPLLRFDLHLRGDETFQLNLSFHHAIMDGWSVATMLSDLFKYYFSLLKESALPFEPKLASSFRDFVAAELEAGRSAEARNYWLTKLDEATVTRLPRRIVPARAADAAPVGSIEVELSPELSDALKSLARRAVVPLKSLFLAAHLRAISLLSGQPDALTGIISHGRPETPDGERVLGLFLNALPFRQQLTGGTWLELIRETFQLEQELYPFRRYPMAYLQKETGGRTLFETVFNYLHFHIYQGLQNSDEMEVLGAGGFEQTNFTLTATFGLDLFTSHAVLRLDYNPNELADRQVDDIGRYYRKILEAMASDPSARYEYQNLLTEPETRQLVEEWNNTATSYPADRCLHELIEEQVERTPDAVALIFEAQSLTYRQLNDRANQLAHHLRKLGAGAESLVAVQMERSTEMVVALLGILKAGAAYVPFDPSYPAERLNYMLADTGATVLLTQQDFKQSVSAPQILCLDTEWERLSGESTDNPRSEASAQNLAYVIYTSGSTGQPKGVMIEHRSLVNYLHWSLSAYGLTHDADDAEMAGAPVHSPLSFDLTITGLFAPLLAGRSVTLLPEGIGLEPLVAALADEHQYGLLKLTPAHLEALNQLTTTETGAPPLISAPRVLVIGGEQLNGDTLTKWRERAPQTRFVNEYGPTETVVGCCVYEVAAGEEIAGAVPIGRPVANTRLYILDEYLNAVPVGVAGELYIAGAGVGRGYLQRAELTAERFVPEPYGGQSGARMYRTGDAARYLGDGRIEYLGRLDEQVKVRGYRIELGEIEAALRESAGVEEAVVVVREEHGEKQLVGYVVTAETGEALSVSGLRSSLEERLPQHMIPARIVMLAEMPLTRNGKVDRRALPLPDAQRPDVGHPFVAPATPVEIELARLWQELLRVDIVGIYDHFFELGGHSILLTQLASRIRKEFQVNVPLQVLFDAPTIVEMTKAILAKKVEQIDQTKAEQMLKKLKQLSPEEIKAFLKAQG